jgi:hypothetical protein
MSLQSLEKVEITQQWLGRAWQAFANPERGYIVWLDHHDGMVRDQHACASRTSWTGAGYQNVDTRRNFRHGPVRRGRSQPVGGSMGNLPILSENAAGLPATATAPRTSRGGCGEAVFGRRPSLT